MFKEQLMMKKILYICMILYLSFGMIGCNHSEETSFDTPAKMGRMGRGVRSRL